MVRLDVPGDLVEEILSRVPATSLGRLLFTCKQWNALFKDPDFIKKHLDKAAKQNSVLMLRNFKLYSLKVNLNNIHNPSIKFTSKLGRSLNKPEQVDITQVFHCNGLLLWSMKESNKTKLVVVNPCTGQTKWIEPRSIYDSRYALGYENNNKSYESYKILRFPNNCKQLEIFELKSNSWRLLSYINPNEFGYTYGRGVSLKGNAYWISYFLSRNTILCFDFTTERFRRLRFPIPDSCVNITIILSVVREEQISFLHKNLNTQQMEIWVTNKIDDNVIAWSISFTLDLSSQFDHLLLSPMSFIIKEEKKVIVVCGRSVENNENIIYIVEKHGSRKFDYDKDQSYHCPPFIFSYVPSLVRLNPQVLFFSASMC